MDQNERLHDALRKNMLFTGIASELNSSFNVLHTGAELLAQQLEHCKNIPEAEMLGDTLRTMRNSLYRVERMSRYINEILMGCNDSLQPCSVCININARLHTMVEFAREESEKRGWMIEFSQSLPPEPVWVMGDEGCVAQIMSILLTNALRMEQSDVAIKVSLREGQALEITDNGPRIPKQVIDAVVKDDFEQKLEGGVNMAGITLYLARLYCEAMGWQMQIKSSAAQTTVRILMVAGQPQKSQPLTLHSRSADPSECRLRGTLKSSFNAAFGLPDS